MRCTPNRYGFQGRIGTGCPLSCGVVVKHADLQHRGCQFDSSTCHFKKNAIGEEGNGKPPLELHFLRKNSALTLVSATLEIEYAVELYKIILGGR